MRGLIINAWKKFQLYVIIKLHTDIKLGCKLNEKMQCYVEYPGPGLVVGFISAIFWSCQADERLKIAISNYQIILTGPILFCFVLHSTAKCT